MSMFVSRRRVIELCDNVHLCVHSSIMVLIEKHVHTSYSVQNRDLNLALKRRFRTATSAAVWLPLPPFVQREVRGLPLLPTP
jgi:hypothetical protein